MCLCNCLPDVLWQSEFRGSSSRCLWLVRGVWLWYSLIILTCFYNHHMQQHMHNTCTTPVGHTWDDISVSLRSESAVIPPEVKHQMSGENQGFPYLWFCVNVMAFILTQWQNLKSVLSIDANLISSHRRLRRRFSLKATLFWRACLHD